MTIIHVCQFSLLPKNGVQAAVWVLAESQARQGNEVEILSLGRKPTDDEITTCSMLGVSLCGESKKSGILQLILKASKRTDVSLFHIHSVFIPWQTLLMTLLSLRKMIYVISPHGNLGPLELKRKHFRKAIYLWIILKRNLMKAGAVACVSKRECEHIQHLIPDVTAFNLGNGVIQAPYISRMENNEDYRADSHALRAVFMGKSDVLHKGFDRMFASAYCFPGGVDFYVIPYNQRELLVEYEDLVRRYKRVPSIRIHPAVYGDDKLQAYFNADCYFHLARWEVFGMVFVEAALAGLPLIISKECDMAEELSATGAALVVDCSRPDFEDSIAAWITSTSFREAGSKARDWASRFYSSEAVARRSIEYYESVIRRPVN